MFKIPEHILVSLRGGNPSQLTPDEAMEVARYIDTLSDLATVPQLLTKVSEEIGALRAAVKSAADKQAQEARMRPRNQRIG